MSRKIKKAVLEQITTSLEGLVQLASWQMALATDLEEKLQEIFAEPGKRATGKKPPPIPGPSEVPMIKRQILPPRAKDE